jgi:hypothetical protein
MAGGDETSRCEEKGGVVAEMCKECRQGWKTDPLAVFLDETALSENRGAGGFTCREVLGPQVLRRFLW